MLFAKDLLDLIPSGKVLHIIRDPRDVVASLLQQRWTPSTLEQIIPWYQNVMQTWEAQKAQLSSDHFLEIRLEHIIDDPSKTIESACDFVGLAFEQNMVDLDLSKANRGRYLTAFSKDEIDLLNKELEAWIY